MAQRIKIQDGKIVYQATDPAFDVAMGVHGYLGVTKELSVGSNPSIDGAIYTPTTSSLHISPGMDLYLEPRSSYIFLNNIRWPLNSPVTGQFISVTGNNTLGFLPFLISFTGSDSLSEEQLNSLYPSALPGQYVAGPTVLYSCISANQWRRSVSASAYTPVNRSGDTMEGYLLLNDDPVQDLGAATKKYVDSIAVGLKPYRSVVTATTSPLSSVVYDNGTSGVGATLTSVSNELLSGIGGYTSISLGDRVLVKNQASAIENGIYIITSLGIDDPLGTPWVLTRASDFDETSTTEVSTGAYFYVDNGTLSGTQWAFLSNSPIIVGTDIIEFTQISGPSTLSSGTGISISSNSITNTGVLSLFAGSGINLSASTGNVTISSTSPSRLIDQTDVLITSPTIGQTIQWDGSAWVNVKPTTTRVINKISDYSLVLDDSYNTLIKVNNSAPTVITIPNDFTTNFPIGATIMVSRIGTGNVTIGHEAGVTIATPSTLSISPQYGRVTLIKTDENFWEIAGSLL